MDAARYFDNAATTPLDPRVRAAMLPYLGDEFGNANSIHAWGLRADEAVEHAREQVATLIGAEDPSQIFFTSGATESNNWVLNPFPNLLISPFEHSSMREPALRRGAAVLSNDGLGWSGRPRNRGIHAALPKLAQGERNEFRGCGSASTLLSVMAVNNEIGTIWDVRELAQPGDILHSDITQAVGKIPITVEGLDYASFSAHKFYGPKGIGALYCKDHPPEPLILGGEQERGYRGGTLNVAAIVGMGAAAKLAPEEREADFAKATELREIVFDGLNGLADFRVNGGSKSSPFILSIGFKGLEGETLVVELDRSGYAISAGAACSSRSTEPSHVLNALTMSSEWLRGTIRVSFGRFNTKEATADLAKRLRTIVEMFRTL